MPTPPYSHPAGPSPAVYALTAALDRRPALPVLQSTDLLGSQPSVEIEHNGQMYRLQATRQGKLILTK
ncbi:MAG: hemin uptake protein HemP [Rhodoferax sp.]|nr:hemin uptake protein HemP [Rhodoferax sp.]MDP3653698.1 hemin uptake protein HemP [Rhodoferax sp.]